MGRPNPRRTIGMLFFLARELFAPQEGRDQLLSGGGGTRYLTPPPGAIGREVARDSMDALDADRSTQTQSAWHSRPAQKKSGALRAPKSEMLLDMLDVVSALRAEMLEYIGC